MKAIISYLLPWQHAGLIRQFAARAIHARYRQSWLGTTWLVLTPLLMLAIYTLVFRNIFQVRWGSLTESNLAFALRLYAGLAVYNFFAECVGRAPGLIRAEPHLVKKVRFPLEILPWINLATGMVHLVIAAVMLCLLGALEQGRLPITLIALPLVWLPLIPLVLGLCWLLSAIGTYVRDVDQLVTMALSVLMFLSPVFFPLDALPAAWRSWAMLNPLAGVMTNTRDVLLHGLWPNWEALAISFLACLAFAALGALFFGRVREGFADVV